MAGGLGWVLWQGAGGYAVWGRIGCDGGGLGALSGVHCLSQGDGLGTLSVAAVPEVEREFGVLWYLHCLRKGVGWGHCPGLLLLVGSSLGRYPGLHCPQWEVFWVPYQGVTIRARDLVGGNIPDYTVLSRGRVAGTIGCCIV